MTMREAVAAAQRDDIGELRLIYLPLRADFPLDYQPKRLNLAGSEERVVRAGFF